MKTTIYSFLCILSVIIVGEAAAQQNARQDTSLQAHIGIIARADKDSIVVRWAPMNPAAWFSGKESGYMLERAKVMNGRTGVFEKVAQEGFHHWTSSQWLQRLLKRTGHEHFDSATGTEHYDSNVKLTDMVIDYEVLAGSLLYDSTSGGSPTLGFNNVSELSERKNSLEMQVAVALLAADRNSAAAEELGLRYVDHNVDAGQTYSYRIYLIKQPRVFRVDTGLVVVKNVPYFRNSKNTITPFEGDRRIRLSWPANRQLGSYFVDRSEDDGRTFQKLMKVSMITLRQGPITSADSEGYLDTTIEDYKPYIYRVYGTTSFADEELVGEVKAMGRDITPPENPIIFNPKEVPIHRAELKWRMNEPVAKDLAGFRVLRGLSHSGEFKPITKGLLPQSARVYYDSTYSDTLPNYYIVEAIDTAKNFSRSFPSYLVVADTTPPAIPNWISGKMDTNGVVTLKIKANHERDLMGYRILRANAPEHEFSSIRESYVDPESPRSRDTVYYDSVTTRTLTRYAYYRVTALDRNYNESPLSAILAVPRPDLIAPVKPVITATHVTDSSVTLDFVPSSSQDVQRHVVYRRLENAKRWDSTAVLSGTAKQVIDTAVKQAVVYVYAIEAVDTAGNRSGYSGAVTARPYPNTKFEGVRDLNVTYDTSAHQVVLAWTPPNIQGVRYAIYRSIGSKGVERYAEVREPGAKRYADIARPALGIYNYSVRVFGADGKQSKLSEQVSIEVKR